MKGKKWFLVMLLTVCGTMPLLAWPYCGGCRNDGLYLASGIVNLVANVCRPATTVVVPAATTQVVTTTPVATTAPVVYTTPAVTTQVVTPAPVVVTTPVVTAPVVYTTPVYYAPYYRPCPPPPPHWHHPYYHRW